MTVSQADGAVSSDTMEGFQVGARVEDLKDGERATVRFVGEVPPTKGLWLGVEWDNPGVRGKHNGSHEGVKYFDPVNTTHEASSSFVRSGKYFYRVSLLTKQSTLGFDSTAVQTCSIMI